MLTTFLRALGWRGALGAAGVVALGAVAVAAWSDVQVGDPGADDGKLTIGFIYVGPKDDFGYNQAAYEGSQAVAKAFHAACTPDFFLFDRARRLVYRGKFMQGVQQSLSLRPRGAGARIPVHG